MQKCAPPAAAPAMAGVIRVPVRAVIAAEVKIGRGQAYRRSGLQDGSYTRAKTP
jgi:hypothetical protein